MVLKLFLLCCILFVTESESKAWEPEERLDYVPQSSEDGPPYTTNEELLNSPALILGFSQISRVGDVEVDLSGRSPKRRRSSSQLSSPNIIQLIPGHGNQHTIIITQESTRAHPIPATNLPIIGPNFGHLLNARRAVSRLAPEAKLHYVPHSTDQQTYVEDTLDIGDVLLRSAVESIPIKAEVYSHLRNPDEYSGNLQFNREGVESLPAFPSPYRKRRAVESIPIEAGVYSHLKNRDKYNDNLQFIQEGVESLPAFPSPYRKRRAVESILIKAGVYSHLRNPDEYSDNLQFNREGVQSLPAFNDMDRNAFIVEAKNETGSNVGQVGNRIYVESRPSSRRFDPDDAPGQVQVNGRPYGQLSEQYAGGRIPDINYEENFVQTY